MKCFLGIVIILFSLQSNAADEKQLQCVLIQPNHQVTKKAVEIITNADGTGGVATVRVENDGVVCEASAIKKLHLEQIMDISISVNGATVTNYFVSEKTTELTLNDYTHCLCSIVK